MTGYRCKYAPSTSNAAASARAFSLRVSSRSSWRTGLAAEASCSTSLSGQLDRADRFLPNQPLDHFLLERNGVRSGHGVTTRLPEEADNSTKRRVLP
jgi:hypothetical protein